MNIPICGFGAPATEVESDLHLRGIVYDHEGDLYVVCVIEYCVLAGCFYYELLELLADFFETPISHVTLHTSHQHDAPYFDEIGHKTAERYGLEGYKKEYWEEIVDKIKVGLKAFDKKAYKQVVYYSNAVNDVHEFASDRRIVHEGKLYWRSTKCQDPFLKSLPAGEFDPGLSFFALYDEDKKPLVTMSFFASHPQVANGRLKISSDAPGVALRRMKEKLPEAFHMYFNGCGGDIGNGKWASKDIVKDLETFGGRLFDAMEKGYDQRQLLEADSFEWHLHQFPLAVKKYPDSVEDVRRATLGEHEEGFNLPRSMRLLGFLEKNIETYPFRFVHLKIGKTNHVYLPSELFCEYQKFVKKILKDSSTCVAAYGNGFFNYVPEDHDFDLGGYEINGLFRIVEKGCEVQIKQELEKALLDN